MQPKLNPLWFNDLSRPLPIYSMSSGSERSPKPRSATTVSRVSFAHQGDGGVDPHQLQGPLHQYRQRHRSVISQGPTCGSLVVTVLCHRVGSSRRRPEPVQRSCPRRRVPSGGTHDTNDIPKPMATVIRRL